ncbi:MAG: trypsin-like peptidase domain-containing protein [Nitrospinae bacterium]|nr:trypsin-like peptidase domain-containing protein [Nitrospinota bacterium]
MIFSILPLAVAAPAGAENLWTEKPKAGAAEEDIAIKANLFSRLAEQLSPSVVNIRIMQKVTVPYQDFPWGPPPGGYPAPRGRGEYEQRGEGSGFIINKDGYILTNSHVVADSEEIQVALSDGKLYKGKVIGMDKLTDIGLVKIDAKRPLPVLPLGDSDRLKTGDWVMAIGSPFGLEQTVTVGIVSAKGRSLGAGPYDDFIQTDTSINPGNSGGPLININGEVVGINTAIMPQGQGLGFSLPINLAKKLLPQIKEKGKVVRAWLGVTVQDITLALKESASVTVDSGSFISSVIANSPAQKAGILPGDVIVEFDGLPIKNSRELPTRVAHAPIGKKVDMKIVREGKTIDVKVTLEKVPE